MCFLASLAIDKPGAVIAAKQGGSPSMFSIPKDFLSGLSVLPSSHNGLGFWWPDQ